MTQMNKAFAVKIEEIFSKEKLPKKIAVAVSGGADSLALTLLLHEFSLPKKIKLFAVTIDHKIRQSSSKEALELGKILAKQKISHEIIAIDRKKIPQKNIEANLREARYEMLCDFCLKNKIEYLFLGHHVGDVAENFLIRLFRGSGLDGLSTIGEIANYQLPVTNYQLSITNRYGEVKIVRPLLDFSKDDLKKFLTEKKIKWFEDETNDDEKFLRNKIRKFLESFEDKNLIQKRIKSASDEISRMRDLFDDEMLDCAKQILEFNDLGYFLIDLKKFKKTEEKIALKILAYVLMEVGGEVYKPRLEKLKNFYEYLLKNDEIKPRNFYGCMAKKYDEKRIVIFREGGSLNKKNLVNFHTILRRVF